MSQKRLYAPRKRNRPTGLFHVLGRTYGVLPAHTIVDVEQIREAYLTYRPATDSHMPPPNHQKPPFNAVGGEVMDDLPELIMPELDDLFAQPVNELVEAAGREDEGFVWEHGGMTIKGRHFDAEHVAFVMKTWLQADD